MKDLIQKVKNWYSEMRKRSLDDCAINYYESIENKIHGLEKKNKALDYCSDSGYLMIFTKKYSELMDELDIWQPIALSAMRRKSERLMAKYA